MENVEALAFEQENKKASPRWEKPIPFEEDKLPSFNLNVFPDWLKDYVEAVAESIQAPVDAASMASISILSTILSKKGYVKVNDDWIEPLNTYSILALPPGNRKSNVFKMLSKPIEVYEQEEYEIILPKIKKQQTILKAKKSRLDSLNKEYAKKGDEGILKDIEALADEIEKEEIIVPPRYFTNDITVEKLGMLMSVHNEKMAILSAEGAGALNNIAGRYDKNNVHASMNLYLEAHPGDSVTIDRVGRDSIFLREPSLTIGLFIQPEILKTLPSSFKERGLMQRFLFSFPKSLVGYREITPKSVEQEIRDKYFHKIKKLLRINPDNYLTFTLSKGAEYLEILNRFEIEQMLQDDEELGNIKEWGSKLAGQLIRIAGLIHFAKHVDQLDVITTEISEETFAAAYSLRNYFIAHAKKAYGIMDSIDDDQDAKYILKRIKERFKGQEVIEHQKLWQLVKRKFKKVKNLDRVLFQLESMNYLINSREGKKKIIQINPMFINMQNNTPINPNDT